MSGFRIGAGLMELAAIHHRDASSTLIDVAEASVRNAAGALKTFFSAFSASITPEGGVTGYGNSGGAPDIGVPTVVCTVEGGVARITYAWTRTDGGGDSWIINSPTTASTDFIAEAVVGSASAEFTCTCTDSIGAVAVAGPVPAFALNLGGPL